MDAKVRVRMPNGKVQILDRALWEQVKGLTQYAKWAQLSNDEPLPAPATPALPLSTKPVLIHLYPSGVNLCGSARFMADLAACAVDEYEVHTIEAPKDADTTWDKTLARAGVVRHVVSDRKSVADIIAKLKPVLVHNHMPQCDWANLIGSIPRVDTYHGYDPNYRDKYRVPICGPNAVPHGVDLDVYGGRVNIGVVGRLAPERLPESFLVALEEFDNDKAHWWFVGAGNGSMTAKYAARLSTIPHVTMLGDVPPENMPLVYAGLHIVVNPCDKEAVGYATIEAMASGCAVVGKNAAGLPDTIGEAGILCNTDAEIMQAVTDLVSSRAKRESYRIAAREWALTRYDAKQMHATYLQIYKERIEVAKPKAKPQRDYSSTLSVVIPTYHTPPDMLRRAVDSILRQTYTAFDLFVIEDGNQPDVPETLADYADKRLHLIRLPHNSGPLLARRAGIEASRSEFVAFQDADDESEPTRLEKQLDYMRHNPRHAVCTVTMRDDDGFVTHSQCNRDSVLNTYNSLHGGPCMFRREAYDQTGGIDALAEWVPNWHAMNLGEDYALWLQFLAAGWDCGRVDELLYRRHRPPTSLTKSSGKKCDENGAKLRELIKGVVK